MDYFFCAFGGLFFGVYIGCFGTWKIAKWVYGGEE